MTKLSDIVLRGAIADRPDPGIPARLYYSEDEYILYRENDAGTAWESIEGTAGTGTFSYSNIGALPSAVVYNSADLTLTTSTQTAITFDSEVSDVYGFHSTTVNTSRLTLPYPGAYLVLGTARWDTSVSTARLQLIINGTTTFAESYVSGTGASTTTTNQVLGIWLNGAVGDYVEMYGFHTKGSDCKIQTTAPGNPNLSPCLTIVFIGGRVY